MDSNDFDTRDLEEQAFHGSIILSVGERICAATEDEREEQRSSTLVLKPLLEVDYDIFVP